MKQLWHTFFGTTARVCGALSIAAIGMSAALAAPGGKYSNLAQSDDPFGPPPTQSTAPTQGTAPANNPPAGGISAPADSTSPLGPSATPSPSGVPAPTLPPQGGGSPAGAEAPGAMPSAGVPGSGLSAPPESLRPAAGGADAGAAGGIPGATMPGAEAPIDEATMKQAIEKGKALLQQEKYEDAIEQFKIVIKGDPKEPLGYFLVGVAARMLNHYDDAIDALSAAIDRLPDNDDKAGAYLRRGIVYFYKGNYGIAWDDFDEAAGLLYDQDPVPELWKGLALARQERWLEAVNAYADALELNPGFVPAYTNRGLAYLALNEPKKAIADFNQAIRRNPHSALNYFNLGVALSRAGKLREALHAYDEAIRVKSDYADAIRNRSEINRRLGEPEQVNQGKPAAPTTAPEAAKETVKQGDA